VATVLSGSVARRYAKALLAIGIEKNQFEAYGRELDSFGEVLRVKELRDTLHNPSHALSRRQAILTELLGRLSPSEPVRIMLLLLLKRNRIDIVSAIAREYRALCDEHAGRVRARVVSAQALDPTASQRLLVALEKKTGKQVLLEQKADPELLAGMVTQVGSLIYDGSLRTRLQQMRESLLEERS
jgi:F-type H+-transporting ATPase subunit delta